MRCIISFPLAFVFAIHILFGLTLADCCSGGCQKQIICPDSLEGEGEGDVCFETLCCDGSVEGIFSCCGVGPCNLACCRCDNGCLGGSDDCPSVCDSSGSRYDDLELELRSTGKINEIEECRNFFKNADENDDGKLSLFEWALYASRGRLVNLTKAKERWSLFDVENKGYLTEEELYNRKA